MSDIASAVVPMVFSLVIFVFSGITTLFQLNSMFTTRNTSGTSLTTYIIFLVCSVFSLCWCYVYYFSRIHEWILDTSMPLIIYQFALIPTMTTYTFAVIGLIFECVIKSKHMQLAKQMHITELQLAKVLVKEAKGNNRSRIQLAIILCTSFIVAFASTTILVVFTTPSINPNIPYLDPSDPVTSTSVITLSVIGAVLWEAISWPQFIKCIQNKDTSGISMSWAIFLPLSCAVSLVYAIILAVSGSEAFSFDTIGAIIFNGLIVNIGILVIKVINRKRAKKLHMSEIEYTRKYIDKKIKRA